MASLPALAARVRARFVVCALFAGAIVFAAGASAPNLAAGGAGANTVPSPVEEFSRQLEAFQKSVPDSTSRSRISAGAIDAVTDVEKARTEIDKLREPFQACSPRCLTTVRFHGSAQRRSNTSVPRSRRCHRNSATSRRSGSFCSINGASSRARPKATGQKSSTTRARSFAGLLQVLQQNEDFIGELIEIRQAEKALEVIRSMEARDIRDASDPAQQV